jgi:hypothetical protein
MKRQSKLLLLAVIMTGIFTATLAARTPSAEVVFEQGELSPTLTHVRGVHDLFPRGR